MKKRLMGRMGLMGVMRLMVVGMLLAGATAEAGNFFMTNTLAVTTSMVGPPTNSVGTNGVAIGVGTAVNVANADSAAFTFYGQGSAAGTSNTVFTLVRSRAAVPAATDWETTAAITLTIPMNGTTAVVWCTNLGPSLIGGYKWVGIGSVTNGFATGSITNCAAYLDYKVFPMRFP